jgi:hypothetical protein
MVIMCIPPREQGIGFSRSNAQSAAGFRPGPVQHDRAVLADRIEHDRLLAGGNNLPHDEDAFGLEPLEMRQICHGLRNTRLLCWR